MYIFTPYLKLFLILVAAVIIYLFLSGKFRKPDRN